ncbi:MAG: hypothetical protein IKI75_02435 [Lachnospiraceae bacterium]|nr:hypothetical protein [Lachnospiraceae bacterium]
MVKGKKKTYLCLFIAALLCELLVFNIRSVLSLFSQEREYPLENMITENAEALGDGYYRLDREAGGGRFYLPRSGGLGDDFRSLRLDIELPQAEDSAAARSGVLDITPMLRDEGHTDYVQLAEHVYREDVPASRYMYFYGGGGIKAVVLDMLPSEGEIIRIGRIAVNPRYPFCFSAVRFLMILSLLFGAYCLRPGSTIWKGDAGSVKRETATAVLLGAALLLPAFILNGADGYVKLPHVFMPYQKLAEALDAGSLSLLEEAPAALAELQNPYDYTERTAAGLEPDTDYLWDTAYYNGKYYCYFGVIPCLLFYLPVYKITGAHLRDDIMIMAAVMFIYAGLYMAVREWKKRRSPETPLGYVMVLTAMCFLGSGLMGILGWPDAHDVPRVCGLAFCVWGLFLWQRGEGLKGLGRYAAIAIGSLCMALAVGCRPNLALYSLLAVPLFISLKDKKPGIKTASVLLLPYVPVAVLLMAYNALRFGSITDFGFAYNLTVLDCTHIAVSPDVFFTGVFEYLFRGPVMSPVFPFIPGDAFAKQDPFGQSTFYYTRCYSGLIAANPFVLSVLWCFRRKKKEKTVLWLLALSALSMLLTVFLAGVAYNYMLDFSLPLLAAGALAVMRIREEAAEKGGEGLLRAVLLILFVACFVYHMCFLFVSPLEQGNTELWYKMYHAFRIL